MSFTNAAVFNVQQNRKLTQFRSRYKRHEPGQVKPSTKLQPKQKLSQSTQRRVRSQQERNLIRDIVLLAVTLGGAAWLFDILLF